MPASWTQGICRARQLAASSVWYGETLRLLGDWSAASGQFQKRPSVGEGRRKEAKALLGLARCVLAETQDGQTAETHLSAALTIVETRPNLKGSRVDVLAELAGIEENRGDFGVALQHLTEAINLARAGDDAIQLYQLYVGQAGLLMKRHDACRDELNKMKSFEDHDKRSPTPT